ncbi:DUF2927 domain-containing protein [Myxacorys almedinensis]|uniref:DUF2927 domain-containing protein n=1 Tax=Myxacorys almedinensis A TaxID=2690445 RepID=A0A8J8CJV1_9CYAN|nr:DUF2927 domain-containing protein [Myxacorys almedinensis]NDJ17961.1 DUF2927 domain-containing protein [Myxacorys almedinensis A]
MNWNSAVQAASRGLIFMGIASAVVSGLGLRSLSNAARSAELVTSDRGSMVNVRANPSVRSQALHYGFAGDRVQILQQQHGDDQWLWYYVKFNRSGVLGWVRSDLIRDPKSVANQPSIIPPSINRAAVNLPTVTLPRVNQPLPTSQSAIDQPASQVATRSVDIFPQPAIAPPLAPSGARETMPNYGTIFTQEQINYFMEIALGSEYGAGANPKIRKWQGDVRVQYFGTPTPADLSTLNTVIDELNALTGGAIRLQLVQNNPNITMYFVPESQFRSYEPRYVPTNFGFFATSWDATGRIYKANVLINSRDVTQKERSHLIREELTQSLGLMRDSERYSNSMFYQPWTDVTQYADIDKALIQMLYNPSIQTGMTKAEVLSTMRTLQAAQSNPSLRF